MGQKISAKVKKDEKVAAEDAGSDAEEDVIEPVKIDPSITVNSLFYLHRFTQIGLITLFTLYFDIIYNSLLVLLGIISMKYYDLK
jgi:hypothetical protein